MKQLYVLLIVLAGAMACRAADGDLFPYPKPPEDLQRLEERCDYIVAHFWDRSDIKAYASKAEKLHNTFGDWIDFFPYATADTVYNAINRLIKSQAKSGPNTLMLARMAEDWLYSDTTEYYNEALYLPFARAAADHGKIKGADKARYQSQVRILDNSAVGATVKNLKFTNPEGLAGDIDNYRTQMVLIYFTDHDCSDCSMARVRLANDLNAQKLIERGLLTILAIEPGDVTPEWQAHTTDYPATWVVGASPDADEYFNIPFTPSFFLLDGRHRVLAKNFNIDGLLAALAELRKNAGV